MKKETVKVVAIECPVCHTIIYSRCRHDFRECKCGKVSIDGGFDYIRISYDPHFAKEVESFDLMVDASKKELYDDWNSKKDKWGYIKSDKKTKKKVVKKWEKKLI